LLFIQIAMVATVQIAMVTTAPESTGLLGIEINKSRSWPLFRRAI